LEKKYILSFSKEYAGTEFPTIQIPSIIIDKMGIDYAGVNLFKNFLQFPNYNAADMINDYVEYQKSLDTSTGKTASEFAAALLNLFNSIVNKELLYFFEIIYGVTNMGLHNFINKVDAGIPKVYKLKELLRRKKVWCYIYGPVHLMRLFVRLSCHALSMNDDRLAVVAAGGQRFLEFVETNVDKYFAEMKYMCSIHLNNMIHGIDTDVPCNH